MLKDQQNRQAGQQPGPIRLGPMGPSDARAMLALSPAVFKPNEDQDRRQVTRQHDQALSRPRSGRLKVHGRVLTVMAHILVAEA